MPQEFLFKGSNRKQGNAHTVVNFLLSYANLFNYTVIDTSATKGH